MGISNGGGGSSAPFNGALLLSTSAPVLPVGAVATPVPFATESYDTGGWHDNATNNSRITVPAGVNRVRLCGWGSSPTAGELFLRIYKNGAAFAYDSLVNLETANGDSGCVVLPVLDVVPGDYFQLIAASSTASTLNSGAWFSVEAIG